MSKATETLDRFDGPTTSSSFDSFSSSFSKILADDESPVRSMSSSVSQKFADWFKNDLIKKKTDIFSNPESESESDAIVNLILEKVGKESSTIRADTKNKKTLTMRDICDYSSLFMDLDSVQLLKGDSPFKITNLVQDRVVYQAKTCLPQKSMIKSLSFRTVDGSPICWEDIDNVTFLWDGQVIAKLDSFVLSRYALHDQCCLSRFLFTSDNPMYIYENFGFQINFHKTIPLSGITNITRNTKKYIYEASCTSLEIPATSFKSFNHYEAFWNLINNHLVHPYLEISTSLYKSFDKKTNTTTFIEITEEGEKVERVSSQFYINLPSYGLISDIHVHFSSSPTLTTQRDSAIIPTKLLNPDIDLQIEDGNFSSESVKDWIYFTEYYDEGYWIMMFKDRDVDKNDDVFDSRKFDLHPSLKVKFNRQPSDVYVVTTVFYHNILVSKNGKMTPHFSI